MLSKLLNKSMGLFLLGAALAFGLVVSAVVIGKTAARFSNSESIHVKGSAIKNVKSDAGSWSGGIRVRAGTLELAAKKLEQDSADVMAFLRAAGFTDTEEIVCGGISTALEYSLDDKGRSTGQVRAYVLSRSFQVSSHNVDAVEKLSREFSSLVKKGILAQTNQTVFVVTDLDSYKMELLEAATRNGFQRAEIMAKSSGGKAGALLSASQGIFQVLSPGGSDISDYGTYDKSTVMKEIRAVVTLEFRVGTENR